MQYVGQRARCVPTARVAEFRRIVECLAHRCDQGFAHLAEAVDLLLRRRERELAPLASVPLDEVGKTPDRRRVVNRLLRGLAVLDVLPKRRRVRDTPDENAGQRLDDQRHRPLFVIGAGRLSALCSCRCSADTVSHLRVEAAALVLQAAAARARVIPPWRHTANVAPASGGPCISSRNCKKSPTATVPVPPFAVLKSGVRW